MPFDADHIRIASGTSQFLGSPTALAAAWPIRNAIDGLGLPHYDWGESFGSASTLETVLTMNSLDRYPDDPAQVFPGDTDSGLTDGLLAGLLVLAAAAVVWARWPGVPPDSSAEPQQGGPIADFPPQDRTI